MTFLSPEARGRSPRFPIAAATALLLTSGIAHAQAGVTASRAADISVFAGAQIAYPAYGPNNAAGVAFGLDYTRYLRRLPAELSLELRANVNGNSFAHENSYLFGLRGAHRFGRVVPYLDFLVGPGDIHYPQNTNYTGDNSIVYNYGGGLDFTLTNHFDLKLDVQGQRWNTGTFQFTPTLGTIGVAYHIPFRRQYGQ